MSLTLLNSFWAVSLTPAKNCRLFGYLYRQDSLIAGVVFTAEKFIACVVDTAEQFIAGVVDTADKHSFAIISMNFQKVKTILVDYSGARGTLVQEKKLRSKILCQAPFEKVLSRCTEAYHLVFIYEGVPTLIEEAVVLFLSFITTDYELFQGEIHFLAIRHICRHTRKPDSP